MRKFVLLAAIGIVAVGCQKPPSRPSVVIARFGELEITADDIDARVLRLDPSRRPMPGEALDDWYELQIRELVVDESLRAMAEAEGMASEPFVLAAEAEQREALTIQRCLGNLDADIDHITEEEIRDAFAASSKLTVPERRYVYSILLRYGSDRTPTAARAEAEGLRARVLGGESFQKLAAESSDSESRHRRGAIGWVRPGQLADAVEKEIFALEAGVPSEPLVTREGVHLFLVDQILPARQVSFEEARPELRQRVLAERQREALTAIADEAEIPTGSLFLDRDELAALIAAGDPDAVALRVGDTELSLGELLQRTRQIAMANPSAASQELPWQVLEGIRRRKLVYRYCREHGEIATDEIDSHLSDWREEALLNLARQRRLADLAARDEDRLQSFYEGNVGFFSRPATWRLRRLRIPLDSHANRVMARLERAAASGSATLNGLQRELGGEIEDLGVRTLNQLRQLEPKLPALVASLDGGQLSSPYRGENGLEIVEVSEHEVSEALPFDQVRERVVAAYVEHYRRDLYRSLSEEILQSAELEIDPEGFAALREAGLPELEISVEQLEALFDQN